MKHLKPTARNAALQALLHVSENEGFSNIVLDKTLKQYGMDKRDNALASHIFYGVLERRITLDYFIAQFLKRPDAILTPEVQMILRIGAYQCLYLDKIPESAIVNEAVNTAKEIGKSAQAGFINGVLRELMRNQERLSLPQDDSLYALSLRSSVPEPLIALWQEAYGMPDTQKLLESFAQPAKTYLRLNTLKDTAAMTGIAPYPNLTGAYELLEKGDITQTDGFAQGLFHVQDLSSQYLCALLDPQENEIILDVCAAPGGKTFTIAQRMNGTGKVYAYDLYKGRVGLIRSGAYRLGLPNVLASMRDACSDTCEVANADRILCDVPCSGFGAIRRKPEIRYKDLQTIAGLPALQLEILEKSSKHIKPGGTLVYATCTLNPAENGAVVERFLETNKQFSGVPIVVPVGLRRTVAEPSYQLTMMPFSGDTDGFFVAILQKTLKF